MDEIINLPRRDVVMLTERDALNLTGLSEEPLQTSRGLSIAYAPTGGGWTWTVSTQYFTERRFRTWADVVAFLNSPAKIKALLAKDNP
jgi:hypothetical protein